MKKVKIHIYKTEVGYFYEPNFKKGAKIIKKWTGQDYYPDNTSGTTWIKAGKSPIIWFEKKDLSVIAHEVIHASWFILDEAGVKIDADNHEALTYLVGYIIKNLKL